MHKEYDNIIIQQEKLFNLINKTNIDNSQNLIILFSILNITYLYNIYFFKYDIENLAKK